MKSTQKSHKIFPAHVQCVVCVCVCIHAHMNVCVHVHVHVHLCECVYVHVCECVCMCVNVCACVCVNGKILTDKIVLFSRCVTDLGTQNSTRQLYNGL